MNRVIALYMGWTENSEYETFNQPVPFFDEVWRFDELPFDTSWSHLIPVWQKLRGELTQTKEMYKLRYNIENAIITCDISTAHKLIHEAIQLIKQ